MNFISLISRIFWNREESRLRVVWRLAIYGILLFLFLMLFSTLIGFANFINGNSLLALAVLMAVLAATFIAGKWVDRRRIAGFGLHLTKAWWKDFGFGLGLGALLMAAIFLVAWLTGTATITGYFQKTASSTPFYLQFINAVLFFVCVGIYEELILRGYLLINLAEGLNFKRLGKKWALISSLVISSIIFGVLHIVNPNASWISTLTISLAGIFLGLGLILTGQLGLSIGLHISWNLFQGNVFGFPVSGVNFGATLIETDLTGPEWMTGGNFGPEAGLLGLLAMLLGCLLIIWWINRKGNVKFITKLAEYHVPEGKTTV